MPRGKGRHSETRVGALVRKHSVGEDGAPYPSLTALGRATGDPRLVRKLWDARRAREFPRGDLIRAIAARLDPVGRALLVDALAWDGALPGYDEEAEPVQRRFSRILRELPADRRAILLHGLEVFAGAAEVPKDFRFAAEEIDPYDD